MTKAKDRTLKNQDQPQTTNRLLAILLTIVVVAATFVVVQEIKTTNKKLDNTNSLLTDIGIGLATR